MAQFLTFIELFKSGLKAKYGEQIAEKLYECMVGRINLQEDILAQVPNLLQQCETIVLPAEVPKEKPIPIRPATVDLETEQCMITGRVVKLSDLPKQNCIPNSKLYYIFATETFLIDGRFNDAGSERTMYVLAPKWQVTQRNALINLNGTQGIGPEPLRGFGEHGESGKPGGAAGNFIGLTLEVVNSEMLKIYAVGGRGGDGQNGSPGKPNVVGATPHIPKDTKNHDFFSRDSCDLVISEVDINGYALSPLGVYRLFGDDNGGNGGNGGRQGEGGQKGEISVIAKQDHSIEVVAKDGEDGWFGLGGPAGPNSVYGDDVYFTCTMVTSGIDKKSYKFNLIQQVSGGRAKDGKTGAEDYFSPLVPRKDGPGTIPLVDVIAKYKAFCGSSCSEEFLEFLDHSRVRRSIAAYEHMSHTNAVGSDMFNFVPLLITVGAVFLRMWRRFFATNGRF